MRRYKQHNHYHLPNQQVLPPNNLLYQSINNNSSFNEQHLKNTSSLPKQQSLKWRSTKKYVKKLSPPQLDKFKSISKTVKQLKNSQITQQSKPVSQTIYKSKHIYLNTIKTKKPISKASTSIFINPENIIDRKFICRKTFVHNYIFHSIQISIYKKRLIIIVHVMGQKQNQLSLVLSKKLTKLIIIRSSNVMQLINNLQIGQNNISLKSKFIRFVTSNHNNLQSIPESLKYQKQKLKTAFNYSTNYSNNGIKLHQLMKQFQQKGNFLQNLKNININNLNANQNQQCKLMSYQSGLESKDSDIDNYQLFQQ